MMAMMSILIPANANQTKRAPAFLMSVAPAGRGNGDRAVGVALLDVSTGEFTTAEYQGRAGQQALAKPRARIDQVLAVVQRQEQLAGPQRVGERLKQRAAGLLADADGGCHTRDDEIGLPQIAKLDKPRAVGEFVRYRGTDLQSQPGLPDPPGPAKRQRTRHAHQPVQLVELALTADETVLFVGQIGRNLSFPLADSGAQHPWSSQR